MIQLHPLTNFICNENLNYMNIFQKNLSGLHLWYTVDVGDDSYDIIERQQGVAFQLGVDVLALCAGSQQLHQGVMIGQRSILIGPLSLGAHHLQQHREGGAVVVEHQHILTSVHQLDIRIT